jgi:hypothetical protein
MAADYTHNIGAGMQEPYPGAVHSGCSFPGGQNPIVFRYRYLQIYINGAWSTVGYA